MKRCLLSCLLILALGGCDLFNLSDETDIVSGRWSSNVVPEAGNCCHIDITLDSNKGDVIGSGIVSTPGQRVGAANDFTIAVSGDVIRERINLTLESDYNPGSIEGTLVRNFNNRFDLVLKVNFEGFGYTGRDILLYPIDEDEE